MNLELLGRVNQLQSQLGYSDANMGASARNWIEQDDELQRRWIAHLEEVLARRVKREEQTHE